MASNALVPESTVSATGDPPQSGYVVRRRGPGVLHRLLSLLTLCAFLAGFACAGRAAYHLATDSFVAPIILSPDSDLVIQSKLSLNRLLAERSTIQVRIEENAAAAEAAREGLDRLEDLRRVSSRALEWSATISSTQATVGETDMQALSQKEAMLDEMIERQARYAREMESSLDAGLVRKSDVEKQENSLSELRIAALQNERDRLATEVQLQTARLMGHALKNSNAPAGLSTPEMLLQKDQLVRIELEMLNLKAERRAKLAQRRADEQELAKLDELVSQMKSRPIYRAIDENQNVAFVPYTQISGLRPGAAVYDCAVWGIFSCSPVGRISEVLPGEVAMQDPWGTPARGQYAILDLSVPLAAQSKALRVRDQGSALWPPASLLSRR